MDYPLPAFSFAVIVDGFVGVGAASFRDVSGMGMELETETLVEGGMNSFVHQLPKAMKPGRLTLKRGFVSRASELLKWCQDTLQEEFGSPKSIKPKTVRVHLRNEGLINVCTWVFTNAYPVKWEIDALSSMKNEVAIEQIDLVYQSVRREV